MDDLKNRRGYRQLKEEALDRTMWRNRFGRDFGPVVWQITDDDDDDDDDGDDDDIQVSRSPATQDYVLATSNIYIKLFSSNLLLKARINSI